MTIKLKQPIRAEKEVLIVGLLCLTAIQIAAVFHGINGVLFASILAVIAGIVGITLPVQIK